MRTQPVELRFQRVQMRKVADPDRAAADLVLVSRPDAACRGADLARAGRRLAQAVELAMDRQDQRAVVGNDEIVVLDGDALALEPGDLVAERPGIEHDAVADDRQRAAHDPRRQQAELVGLVANHERVAGVVPALEANHGIRAAGQPVDDLALALIAPLGADHGDIGQESGPFSFCPTAPRPRRSPAAGQGAAWDGRPIACGCSGPVELPLRRGVIGGDHVARGHTGRRAEIGLLVPLARKVGGAGIEDLEQPPFEQP